MIEAAREFADVVLIDSAPLLSTNDTSDLMPYVDATLVVCRAGRTTGEQARRVTNLACSHRRTRSRCRVRCRSRPQSIFCGVPSLRELPPPATLGRHLVATAVARTNAEGDALGADRAPRQPKRLVEPEATVPSPVERNRVGSPPQRAGRQPHQRDHDMDGG